jgi:hypothetical protein
VQRPGSSSGGGGSGNAPPWDSQGEGDDQWPCPPAGPDTPHGSKDSGTAYEIFGHIYVNPNNPLQPGQAILYHGEYYDDCAQQDDPQGRWKAGDMIEFKGDSYSPFIPYPWWRKREAFLGQASRQNAGVEGTGRRDVYLVNELAAVELIKELLYENTNIDVFHVPIDPSFNARGSKPQKTSFFLRGNFA